MNWIVVAPVLILLSLLCFRGTIGHMLAWCVVGGLLWLDIIYVVRTIVGA